MAGYLLASGDFVQFGPLLLTLVGTAFIIASACVVNNYLDRGIDAKMARTRERVLAAARLPVWQALVYAAALLASGVSLLVNVNKLTAAIGLAGWLAYTILYSLAKRRSHHGTLIGTISGATPPVAGYAAVTNQLDTTAGLLFLLLVCWQMAHFYAIALYRLKEYKAAAIPVLPLVKGPSRTKTEIVVYILGFWLVGLLLAAYGPAGATFVGLISVISLIWLNRISTYSGLQPEEWGRQKFRFSLQAILIICLGLSLNAWLP